MVPAPPPHYRYPNPIQCSLRSYYRKMDEILSMYADETNKAKLRDEVEGGDKSKRTSRDNTDALAKVSFFTNLVSLTPVPQQL